MPFDAYPPRRETPPHRDALHIGLELSGITPDCSRRLIGLPGFSDLATGPDQQPSASETLPALVPSGGWVCSRRSFTFRLAVPELHRPRTGQYCIILAVCIPHPVLQKPSSDLPKQSLPSLLPHRDFAAAGSTPLTASSVHLARFRRTVARRVFQCRQGHCRQVNQVKFYLFFQAVKPSRSSRKHPFDKRRLRLESESRKQNRTDLSTARILLVDKWQGGCGKISDRVARAA